MASIDSAEHYTVISADTHAGGSHAQYREYLEEKYLDDFDACKYKNPFSDLGDYRCLRNWDDEMRTSQQDDDGVAGEVIFPNTVPPFFPSFVLFARPPKADEYEHRLAGIRAHNRWLVDFCAKAPERRKGIGQIFINDIDDHRVLVDGYYYWSVRIHPDDAAARGVAHHDLVRLYNRSDARRVGKEGGARRSPEH